MGGLHAPLVHLISRPFLFTGGRSRRRHPQSHVEVRTHLLDAARRAFARQGDEGASSRDIAAEAKGASGLLCHDCPSKQVPPQALFERCAGHVPAAFAQVAGIRDPRRRRTELIRVSADLVREHEELRRVAHGVRNQHAVVGSLSASIAAQSAVYLGLFTTLLDRIGRPHPALEARLLLATLDGVFQHHVLEPTTCPLDDVIERVIDQLTATEAS